MKLKTGRKCSWEEIKVDEIFAWNGCWEILLKISESDAIILACDSSIGWEYSRIAHRFPCSKEAVLEGEIYKLPKSVQVLWKEE